MDEKVGAMIRRLREAEGLSKTQLASRLADAGLDQIHPTTISRMEAGERGVRLSEATAITEVLNTDIGTLLDHGGIEALMRQMRMDHHFAEKSLEDLIAAASVTRARQMLLHYAVDKVEATGLADLESESARKAAREEIRSARELSERSPAAEVDLIVNDWDDKIPAWIEGEDSGVDPEAS